MINNVLFHPPWGPSFSEVPARGQENDLDRVQDHPRGVADEEDDHDDDEHPGDPLVPLLPLAGPGIPQRRVPFNNRTNKVSRLLSTMLNSPDDLECEAVEDDEEEEGDEGHHYKVWDKQVVPAVAVAVPDARGANLQSSAVRRMDQNFLSNQTKMYKVFNI